MCRILDIKIAWINPWNSTNNIYWQNKKTINFLWQVVLHVSFQVTKTLQHIISFLQLYNYISHNLKILLSPIITVYKKRSKSFKWFSLWNVWEEFIDRKLIAVPSSLYSIFFKILWGIYFTHTNTGKYWKMIFLFLSKFLNVLDIC